MSDSFSPLFSSRPAGAKLQSMRVEVVSIGGLTPVAPVIPVSEAVAAHPVCDPAKPVKVSLEKTGDIVTGIRIDCGCGQVIHLACDY